MQIAELPARELSVFHWNSLDLNPLD